MKFRFFILSFLIIKSFCAVSQPFYQKGYRSVTYNDPSRAGRAIATDVYYPATTAGTNVPVASGSVRFPVVVFGHGFSLPASAYTKLADTLTRYGYIAAFPTTETGLSPSHDNFGKDLSFVCTALIQSDSDPTSFLYQRVTSKAAVGGHSMGGGCSFLAAGSGNSNIYALFNMAAAETNPSAISAAASVTIPSLVFSGSSDCIVPPATQQSMYNNIANACKSQITITGATHCQIADNNFTCTFGQISSGCNSSSINVATVYTKVTELLIPFLDYTLNGNCFRGIDFVSRLGTLSGVSVTSNCPSPNCSILPVQIRSFSGQGNHGNADLQFEIENPSGNPYTIFVEKSSDGNSFSGWKSIQQQTGDYFLRKNLTDSSPYKPVSFYRLRLESNGNVRYSGIVMIKPASPFNICLVSGNPVRDNVGVRFGSAQESPVVVRIFSADGRLCRKESYGSISAGQTISIPIGSLSSGVYIAEVSNPSAGDSERIRFVKSN